jgi:hypothetical protein
MEDKRIQVMTILQDYFCKDTPLDVATDSILCLFSVVGRSEQLCDFLEWYDKSLSYEEREMHVKTYTDMKLHNCH